MGYISNLREDLIWNLKSENKVIYLTFDDGPIPNVTTWVLNQLNLYNAKATFFCVGENIYKYPQIFKEVIDNEHSVGNHTYNHINGWKTKNYEYFKNIFMFDIHYKSNLFRPPYGKISLSQIRAIKKRYKIIMWSVLSGDYNYKKSPQECLDKVLLKSKNGSIVLFHDSVKAWKNLKYSLPLVLSHFSKKGYEFKKIEIL